MGATSGSGKVGGRGGAGGRQGGWGGGCSNCPGPLACGFPAGHAQATSAAAHSSSLAGSPALTPQLVPELFLTACRHGSVRTAGRDVAFVTVLKTPAAHLSHLIPCVRHPDRHPDRYTCLPRAARCVPLHLLRRGFSENEPKLNATPPFLRLLWGVKSCYECMRVSACPCWLLLPKPRGDTSVHCCRPRLAPGLTSASLPGHLQAQTVSCTDRW